MSYISSPDGVIRTGRDHGNEMKDETARLDWELNPVPSGWITFGNIQSQI